VLPRGRDEAAALLQEAVPALPGVGLPHTLLGLQGGGGGETGGAGGDHGTVLADAARGALLRECWVFNCGCWWLGFIVVVGGGVGDCCGGGNFWAIVVVVVEIAVVDCVVVAVTVAAVRAHGYV